MIKLIATALKTAFSTSPVVERDAETVEVEIIPIGSMVTFLNGFVEGVYETGQVRSIKIDDRLKPIYQVFTSDSGIPWTIIHSHIADVLDDTGHRMTLTYSAR